MTDLTPIFNGILKGHEAPSVGRRSFSVDNLDEFLKEAYKIRSSIASLHADLRNIRQSYLSTAQPRRHLVHPSQQKNQQSRPLSDREREEIDAQMKQMLRALNGSIRNLVDAEQVRHETALTVIHKKHGRGGLNNLARAWAAGGSSGSAATSSSSKSVEQIAAEDREATVSTHRESVLWFLRQRLQECVEAQQNMMEIRIAREMEKNRSVLAKAQARAPPGLIAPPPLEGNGTAVAVADHGKMKSGAALSSKQHAVAQDEASSSSASYNPVEGLTQEQVQMFEQDNKEMLRHYESTLDQVRTAQKSLIEISELQTQLVGNLATQSAHIDQLVADSMNTTENVGGGNKQLKQATQKPSTAKYTFFATCGLCAFLIVWDLVI